MATVPVFDFTGLDLRNFLVALNDEVGAGLSLKTIPDGFDLHSTSTALADGWHQRSVGNILNAPTTEYGLVLSRRRSADRILYAYVALGAGTTPQVWLSSWNGSAWTEWEQVLTGTLPDLIAALPASDPDNGVDREAVLTSLLQAETGQLLMRQAEQGTPAVGAVPVADGAGGHTHMLPEPRDADVVDCWQFTPGLIPALDVQIAAWQPQAITASGGTATFDGHSGWFQTIADGTGNTLALANIHPGWAYRLDVLSGALTLPASVATEGTPAADDFSATGRTELVIRNAGTLAAPEYRISKIDADA